MGIFDFNKGTKKDASSVAEERLKLILIQDRLSLSSREFENLKQELINTLSKYFDIEKEAISIKVEKSKAKQVFEAIVPVHSVKKEK